MRRRRKKSNKDGYILNYTVGNVARRTGETRDDVRSWLKIAISKRGLSCPFCGQKITLGSFAVDHKDPISRGGVALLSNCWLTCQPCNRAKGDLTVEEYQGLLAYLGDPRMTYAKKSILARLKIAGALYRGR